MRLLTPPEEEDEIIDIGGRYNMGRRIITNCTILAPHHNTAEQKMWNKLQYDNYVPLWLGGKIPQINFPDQGYILYGVVPVERMIQPESTEFDGEIYVCTVDHFAYNLKR